MTVPLICVVRASSRAVRPVTTASAPISTSASLVIERPAGVNSLMLEWLASALDQNRPPAENDSQLHEAFDRVLGEDGDVPGGIDHRERVHASQAC